MRPRCHGPTASLSSSPGSLSAAAMFCCRARGCVATSSANAASSRFTRRLHWWSRLVRGRLCDCADDRAVAAATMDGTRPGKALQQPSPGLGRWHRALISNRRHHEIDRACFGRQRLREPAETDSAAEESGFGPSNGYRSARAAEQRLRASPRRARTQPTPSVRSSLS